jgi:hypothetical protein
VLLACAGGCAVCCWRVVHPGACCCNRAPSFECWRGSLVVWRRLGGEPGERAWVGESRCLAFSGPCRSIAGPSHGRAPRRHSSPPAFSIGGVVVSSPFCFGGMVSPWPIARSCLSKCEHLLHRFSPSFFAAVLTFGEWAPMRVWPPVLSVSPPACPAGSEAASCKLQAGRPDLLQAPPSRLQQGHPTWVVVTTAATIMLWCTHGAARQSQPLWSCGDFR